MQLVFPEAILRRRGQGPVFYGLSLCPVWSVNHWRVFAARVSLRRMPRSRGEFWRAGGQVRVLRL